MSVDAGVGDPDHSLSYEELCARFIAAGRANDELRLVSAIDGLRTRFHLTVGDLWRLVRDAERRAAPREGNPLTKREAAILTCVAQGMQNQEIARRLSVSPSTVKSHLDRIFDKVGARDRTRAVVIAMSHGWISVGQYLGDQDGAQ